MRVEPLDEENPKSRPELVRLRTIADWMDRRYLDPIIGLLFPGGGDTLGAVIGLYAVLVARKLRVHPIVIARMLVNLALDALLGSIPFLGWIADFFYRANTRNLELLETRSPRREATASDWVMVGGAVVLFIFALAAPVILMLGAVAWLFSQL